MGAGPRTPGSLVAAARPQLAPLTQEHSDHDQA